MFSRNIPFGGIVLCLTMLAFQNPAPAPSEPFIVKAYLQLGDSPALEKRESLLLMWHTPDEDARWSISVRQDTVEPWHNANAPISRRIALPGVAPHRVYRAQLEGLTPGATFLYQVRRNNTEVFSSYGRARRAASEAQRFVLFGDCAADTAGQRAVSYQTFVAKPDYVFIPGDIVYTNGRISESHPVCGAPA